MNKKFLFNISAVNWCNNRINVQNILQNTVIIKNKTMYVL